MDFITVTGRANISAKIIADSFCAGNRIITFELEYPRFIHAEFMTHRLFSRNAASSRAIPVSRMLELVRDRPATFVHWGKNQAGMQANEELSGDALKFAQNEWKTAAHEASTCATILNDIGAHKQIVNRLLEPFQMMKVVCTATEWDNFLYLRNHRDAQPEIHELASVMWEAMKKSTPELLTPGQWHTPYVKHHHFTNGAFVYTTLVNASEMDKPENADREFFICIEEEGMAEMILTLEEALMVSASCCAQVSYRRQDDSLEKARDIYKRLIESKPCHASPVEHQATPILSRDPERVPANLDGYPATWEKGITHQGRNGKFWSGNFCGWIQARQLVKDHTCWEYRA